MQQWGGRKIPERSQQGRQCKGREERLIDNAIYFVWLIGAGKPCNQDRHPGEERTDEDDNDDDDLPTRADGGVRWVSEKMTNHHVIDDALQTGDYVLQHGRPGQAPNGGTNRPLDDRAVEFLRRFSRGLGLAYINRSAHRSPYAIPTVMWLPDVESA